MQGRSLVGLVSLTAAALAAGAPPDPAASLAESAYPALARLAVKLVAEQWAARADELLASAPLEAPAGPAWRAGDEHWEAAKAELVARVERWATSLSQASEAKEVVVGRFSGSLKGDQVAAVAARLADPATSGFGEYCDVVHLGAEFAAAHPELRVGSREFQGAFTRFLTRVGVPASTMARSSALDALMRSPEGTAYSTARGFALRALAHQLDGQVQLRFYDAQADVASDIEAAAARCRSGHRH